MNLSTKDRKYIPSDWDMYNARSNLNRPQKKLFDFVDQTGCRIDEALRLRRKDVDEDYVTLWTREAKNSDLTPRLIPRPDCLKDKNLPPGEDDRVFSTWSRYPRFIDEAIYGLQKDDPNVKKWSWHNLRHRRASLWAKGGMPTIEIMERLGHNNIETTMKYLQLLGFSRR
jgi:integrase